MLLMVSTRAAAAAASSGLASLMVALLPSRDTLTSATASMPWGSKGKQMGYAQARGKRVRHQGVEVGEQQQQPPHGAWGSSVEDGKLGLGAGGWEAGVRGVRISSGELR